jgi:hypothetical protein
LCANKPYSHTSSDAKAIISAFSNSLLQKKHITSTPFKGSKQQMEMPAEIKDYMELKFQGIASFQVS